MAELQDILFVLKIIFPVLFFIRLTPGTPLFLC